MQATAAVPLELSLPTLVRAGRRLAGDRSTEEKGLPFQTPLQSFHGHRATLSAYYLPRVGERELKSFRVREDETV